MSLLTYSGITTKVRAMESRLLTEAQFEQMASLEDVRSAADFLKQQPAYAEFFTGLDDTRLHRGSIEQLLTLSLYRDFVSLYRFSSLDQRKFLDLYFMQYEVAIIKRILRHVTGHQELTLDLSVFREFFERHSSIRPEELAKSENLTDFIARLEGTPYYRFLSRLTERGQLTSFNMELQLDQFFFKTLWKIKTKVLTKAEQHVLDQCFGCRLDLLNLQWISRAKQFYALSSADIYALLIPIHYKLNPDQIRRLVEASGMEEFYAVLKDTAYWRFRGDESNEKPDTEVLYRQTLNRIYHTTSRKNPYSLAVLDSYLYFKELEMQKIITILEGIRYGLDAGEILALAAKQ